MAKALIASKSWLRRLAYSVAHKQKNMKPLLISLIFIISGCSTIQDKIDYTHMINPKHLPIELEDDTGNKYEINKGNYVEVKKAVGKNWEIETIIKGNIKRGLIPRNSKNGNPTLICLEEFDNKINKVEAFCSEIQLSPKKALTLRERPLNDIELKEIITNRSSNKSTYLNRETAIIGVQHGVDFELIDDTFGAWQKIKIQSKNMELVGFINKEVNGKSTRKNNCQ